MTPLFSEKIVSAKAMAEVEKESIREGADEKEYMLNAAKGIAARTIEFNPQKEPIFLLAGKGNNGGDAYAAGEILLREKYRVEACTLYAEKECSPLCTEMRRRFEKAGGTVHRGLRDLPKGLILDGLLGTGFQGAIEGDLRKLIEKANGSKNPILAIDIPSGLNGSTGRVETVAIKAAETIFLGLSKWGFFINGGYEYVGKLHKVDFGLPAKYIEKCRPEAFLFPEEKASSFLPEIKRTRHKYQAGYVIGVGGGAGMAGAAVMSAWAALKAGAGIVRLFYPEDIKAEIAKMPLEIVKQAIQVGDIDPILKEAQRAKACFIGPGMGRSKKSIDFMMHILEKIEIPCVCDADALFALAEREVSVSAPLVLTPHRGEMLRLLQREQDFEDDRELIKACREYAQSKGWHLVLKGAPSWFFSPGEVPLVIAKGDPGMAKAGSGDVLTGIIAAMLAQKLPLEIGGPLGVYLHGLAGEIASKRSTAYALMATDLIQTLPEAFKKI